VALPLRQYLENCGDVLFYAPVRGVDHEMFALPPMIFPANHLFPSRQLQSWNVGGPRFHPASMFVFVGARYLNFNRLHPGAVGNRQQVLVSELAGRSNVLAKASELGLDLSPELATVVLDSVKEAEHRGYAYEAADASFELLVRKIAGALPSWFTLDSYRVVIERAAAADRSEAIVRLRLGADRVVAVGEGVGPVHALDQALRRGLADFYPQLERIHLVDYKVRILDGRAATSAVTRVMLTSADHEGEWTTVGVSDDIVTASWEALADGVAFGLLRAGAQAPEPVAAGSA